MIKRNECSNSLFVICSPIGNINDASKRLIETLEEVEILFCEDTRVTSKLLLLLKINNRPKLISYHKYTEKEKLSEVINLISEKKCGIISDAGYPAISDPGHILINECHKNNIWVEVIDGPSSLTHAIVQSGFDSSNFIFIGFLERNENDIKKQLENKIILGSPIICYESVHRINKTISILKKYIPNNEIYIGRELTKKFESVYTGKIIDIKEVTEKGEFTIIINSYIKESEYDFQKLINEIDTLEKYGMKVKDSCKYLTKDIEIKSQDLYNFYLKNKKNI